MKQVKLAFDVIYNAVKNTTDGIEKGKGAVDQARSGKGSSTQQPSETTNGPVGKADSGYLSM